MFVSSITLKFFVNIKEFLNKENQIIFLIKKIFLYNFYNYLNKNKN